MGYFGHLALAWINALRLLASSFFLVVHGLMPFLLVHAASETIAKVRNSFPKAPTDRILVRFNTKWRDDPEGRQWRVLVNGEETLASRVTIRTGSDTIEESVGGEQKFHFLCLGKAVWDGSRAEII